MAYLDESREAEVRDLDEAALGDEDVPGGEVAMDVVLGLEVRHPRGDLCGHVDQLLQLQTTAFT